jgi:hypothetical protein
MEGWLAPSRESLSHTKSGCKYQVVFIPMRRRKTLYGELRQHWGEVFRKLAKQKRVGSKRATCWRTFAQLTPGLGAEHLALRVREWVRNGQGE